MPITRYTTPTAELTVEGIDLTEADVYVTIKQGNALVTFTGEDLDVSLDEEDSVIRFTLSQEQTARFNAKQDAQLQINWVIGNTRNATEIPQIRIMPNLLEEVISYD